ncbi:hypothetical protein V4F39_09685 [Aquincola sp. MAHUQ-54]|uniref:DUF3299 domain-containing protein n=1 Tax=Aquincola agrisoli TaxID=3119538 RepID=A0AAW9QFL1_9BURK
MTTSDQGRRTLVAGTLAALCGLGGGAARAQQGGGAGLPVITWELMAQARASTKPSSTAIDFPAALVRLDGRQVAVTGFMVPLEAKAQQTRFLLTQKPQDCEFCIEGGPSAYIEVRSDPLKFSSKPFTLVGRIKLLRDDPSGMYYRLIDARQVPA